jgi:hypothetical protein
MTVPGARQRNSQPNELANCGKKLQFKGGEVSDSGFETQRLSDESGSGWNPAQSNKCANILSKSRAHFNTESSGNGTEVT